MQVQRKQNAVRLTDLKNEFLVFLKALQNRWRDQS